MGQIPSVEGLTGIVAHYSAAASQGDHVEMAMTYGTQAKAIFGASHLKILNPSEAVTRALISIGLIPICRPYNEVEHQHGSLPWWADLYRTQNFLNGGGKLVESDDNEWNVIGEYGGWPSPERIAELWVEFARWVLRNGGCPGTPATTQGGGGGGLDDVRDALPRFIRRVNELDPGLWSEEGVWVSYHAYGLNHPPDAEQDQCYILSHRVYHKLFFDLTGRSLPFYCTEGGPPPVGESADNRYPPVTPEFIRDTCVYIKRYKPEPYLHGRGGFWLLHNDGGNYVWYPSAYLDQHKPRGDHELAINDMLITPVTLYSTPAFPPGEESVTTTVIGNLSVTDLRAELPDEPGKMNPVDFTVKDFISIHHTVTSPTATAKAIYDYHKSLGWGGIGYNFLIWEDGKIAYVGECNTARAGVGQIASGNRRGIHVAMVGDYSAQEPPAAMLAAVKLLTANIQHAYGFFMPIVPHLLFNTNSSWDTACPGSLWRQWWHKILRAVGD